ncbi:MAG: ubiquinol-cytochrome c reductase iron-sulfur subunit [Deltaproteobacteria bacterium]|nr:ubiquinol-cytochrome c reductase iron-sulfur subunit [Deltaproteobacteria bacterium]
MTDACDASRRRFLKQLTFTLGGMIAAGLMVPGGAYFLSPLWGSREEDWIEIADAKSIPLGEPVKIDFIHRQKDGWATIEGRASVWVVTTDGEHFTAYDPRCTHLGCPYRWDASQRAFLCPCHTAIFNLEGTVLSGPAPRPLDRYPTTVTDGKLQIRPVLAEHGDA